MRHETMTGLGLVALLALAGCGADAEPATEIEQDQTEAADATEVDPATEEDEQPTADEAPDNLVEREREAFTALWDNPGAEAEAAYEEIMEEIEGHLGHITDADDLPDWFYDLKLIEMVEDMGGTVQQLLDDELPDEPDPDNAITREFYECEEGRDIAECEEEHWDAFDEDLIQYDLEECAEIIEYDMRPLKCSSSWVDEAEFQERFMDEYGYEVPEEYLDFSDDPVAEEEQADEPASGEGEVPRDEIAEWAPAWPADEPMSYEQLDFIKEERRLWDEWEQAEPGSAEEIDLLRQIDEHQDTWSW